MGFIGVLLLHSRDKQELEVLTGQEGHLTEKTELVWIRGCRVISAYQMYLCTRAL